MSLRERRDILSLANEAAGGVLVTLVRAAGSSYRQPGARLLAMPDGHTAGTISGGCLEADLLRKAQWRVRDGAAMQRYDTSLEDGTEIPFGLGCGGVVDLLLEPRDTPEAAAALDAIVSSIAGEARTVVTQLPTAARPFARIVLDPRRDVVFATEALETDRIVDLRAAALLGTGNDPDLFIETLAPAQRLIVCGAGEDAKPITRVAAELGWSVLVADGRPQQARAERFPAAHAVHVTDSLLPLRPSQADAVVLLTHSFEQDERLLTELLALSPAQRPRYIGLLGARSRSALLLSRAAATTGSDLGDAISTVHAPVGLLLGGEGPESIALSIVAEVQHHIDSATLHPTGVNHRRMNLSELQDALARLGNTVPTATRCDVSAAEPVR